jgi:hypothetical protein
MLPMIRNGSVGEGSAALYSTFSNRVQQRLRLRWASMRLEKLCARSRRGQRAHKSAQSQAPCVQRTQRSLRVLLQSEHRLLGQALGLGDDR